MYWRQFLKLNLQRLPACFYYADMDALFVWRQVGNINLEYSYTEHDPFYMIGFYFYSLILSKINLFSLPCLFHLSLISVCFQRIVRRKRPTANQSFPLIWYVLRKVN